MFNLIRRLFALLVLPSLVRYGVYPTSADGVAAAAVTLTAVAVAWTWGNYAQIVAATTAQCQICGFELQNIVGAVGQGEIQIASGAALTEVPLITVPVNQPDVDLPVPVLVESGVRLSARYRTSTGAADTVDIKLKVRTGY